MAERGIAAARLVATFGDWVSGCPLEPVFQQKYPARDVVNYSPDQSPFGRGLRARARFIQRRAETRTKFNTTPWNSAESVELRGAKSTLLAAEALTSQSLKKSTTLVTPAVGSLWLKSSLAALPRQSPDRRIGAAEQLGRRTRQRQRNAEQKWRFTTDAPRTRFSHLYPQA